MNFLKNLPNWLKGGVMSLAILIVVGVILVGVKSRWLCEYNDTGDIVCSIDQILSTFIYVLSWLIGISFIPFFIAGSGVGWIIGKLKNK